MSRWGTVTVLSQTAWQECALLGHREIDVEHVLLATMDDHEVASLMARHGVTREGTRRQVDAVVQDQLAALGIDLGATSPGRRAPTDLHHDAVGELEVTDRARRLVGEARSMAGAALAALQAPDGTAAALLQRQGAEVDRIRAELAALAEPSPGRPRTGAGPDLGALPDLHLIEGDPGHARRRSAYVAAPWERVWEQASTAKGARAWLMPTEDATVAGPGELCGEVPGRGGRRAEGPASRGRYLRRLLAAETPREGQPGHVLWQDHLDLTPRWWRPARTGPGQWSHLTVTPQGEGTQVDLVLGTVVWRRGVQQSVLRPVIRLGQAFATRNALYQLGLAVEGPAGKGSVDAPEDRSG